MSMSRQCFYCNRGDHRQCRLLKVNKEICGCTCTFAKDFREDVEMYKRLDRTSTIVGVYRRLFPWKKLKTIKS